MGERMGHEPHVASKAPADVVLHVAGMYRASEKAVVEAALGRSPGVLAVQANPVAQTATVRFDPGRTRLESQAQGAASPGAHVTKTARLHSSDAVSMAVPRRSNTCSPPGARVGAGR